MTYPKPYPFINDFGKFIDMLDNESLINQLTTSLDHE